MCNRNHIIILNSFLRILCFYLIRNRQALFGIKFCYSTWINLNMTNIFSYVVLIHSFVIIFVFPAFFLHNIIEVVCLLGLVHLLFRFGYLGNFTDSSASTSSFRWNRLRWGLNYFRFYISSGNFLLAPMSYLLLFN